MNIFFIQCLLQNEYIIILIQMFDNDEQLKTLEI